MCGLHTVIHVCVNVSADILCKHMCLYVWSVPAAGCLTESCQILQADTPQHVQPAASLKHGSPLKNTTDLQPGTQQT